MDFSLLFPHSSVRSSVISPDRRWVLSAVSDRVVLRAADTLEVQRSWRGSPDAQPDKERTALRTLANSATARHPAAGTGASKALTDDRISCLAFSPRSSHALALLRRPEPTVLVFAMHADEPVARLVVGAEGVATDDSSVRWSAGGDAILVWSDWGLRVTVWPLTQAQPRPMQITLPKCPPPAGWTSSPDGRFVAVLSRHASPLRDVVGVYDTQRWCCARHFTPSSAAGEGPDLNDVVDLEWSPCGRYLALVDSAIYGRRLEIRTPSGKRLGLYAAEPTAGQADSAADAGSSGLGIRSLRWRPQGDALAVGGWDGKVTILNDFSWTALCTLDLLEKAQHAAACFSEPADWLERTRGRAIVSFDQTASANSLQGGPTKRSGVQEMAWSADGLHLACRTANTPEVALIFSFSVPDLADGDEGAGAASVLWPTSTCVVECNAAIQSLHWHPSQASLWMTCGTNAVYVWQQGPCAVNGQTKPLVEGIGIPSSTPFAVEALQWSSDGKALLVSSKSAFCLAFPATEV